YKSELTHYLVEGFCPRSPLPMVRQMRPFRTVMSLISLQAIDRANTRNATNRMASYRKNIAVGATMIGALALLGLMILLFGEAPVRLFKPRQLQIKFLAESGEGLVNGSPILYLGVNIGQVKSVELPNNEPGVIIFGQVESKRVIPGNVEAVIRSS